MVADLSGSLTGMKRHDYLPFGEEIGAGVGIRTAGQGYPPPDDKVRQKFTGYERDGETGLDYAQARMYANVQGRFTSVDPVPVTKENFVNPQRWNQYNYVNNNPMSHFDPNGADGKGKGGDKVITVVMSLAVDEKGRGKHATNWNEVKEKAKANGYKLEMIEGGKPSQTREAIATALKTSEVVIFVSHGAAESRSPGEPYVQKGIWAAGNYYSSKGVTAMSDVPSIGQIEVLAKPEVSANVVCNFSCDAKGKTDSYFNFTGQNQTVVEANGGVGGQTSTSTLEAAAAAFAGTYKGNVATATNAANKTVQNQAKYQDLNGDLVNNDGDRIERRRATKR
jgi:RHS repeat-associated protein